MTADPEPRWQRLEPDARRRQILECAIRLFGERPFAAVSTTEIAREAEVARGLINHYFGNKRDLYLEVIRVMVTLPPPDHLDIPSGSLAQRADAFIAWFLDAVEQHGRTWLVAVAGEGLATDPDVQRILKEADDRAADGLIDVLGLADHPLRPLLHAQIRSFGGMTKAAGREWILEGTLNRDEVHALLVRTLLAVVGIVDAGTESD